MAASRLRTSEDDRVPPARPIAARAARELDDAFRTCFCFPFSRCGCRPTLPTDPWFEPTILDHYRVVFSPLDRADAGPAKEDDDDDLDPPGAKRKRRHHRAKRGPAAPHAERTSAPRKLTPAQADVVIEAIERASPRVRPQGKTLGWLACTSDSWGCGRWPRGEARDGFRVVRKVSVNLRTGRVLVTVWPEYQDAVDVAMRQLAAKSLRGGLRTLVLDRSNTGRTFHLVEAVPVDDDMLDKRLPNGQRIPIAKVICGPREDCREVPEDASSDDADDDDDPVGGDRDDDVERGFADRGDGNHDADAGGDHGSDPRASVEEEA